MQCNIDARGKAVRLISGFITLAVAAALLIAAALGAVDGPWLWIAGAAAGAGALFQIYEGWSGWCAVRAMGVKTPI